MSPWGPPNANPRARDPRARRSDPRATELTRIIFP